MDEKSILLFALLLAGCGDLEDVLTETIETVEQSIPATTYTEEELTYFTEIAFGNEWDDAEVPIRKWQTDPRIQVFGEPSAQGLEALQQTMTDINAAQSSIELTIVEESPNINLYFVPLADFPLYVDNPTPNNWGLFYYWWDDGYGITNATVLISTDKPNAEERAHLTREELTQALGLVRDSYQYPDSIFYQEWTSTTSFAPIDETLLEMLYDPRIEPGMNEAQARSILSP